LSTRPYFDEKWEKAFFSDESKGGDYDPHSSRTTLHRTRSIIVDDNKWVDGKDLWKHVTANELQDRDTIAALGEEDRIMKKIVMMKKKRKTSRNRIKMNHQKII